MSTPKPNITRASHNEWDTCLRLLRKFDIFVSLMETPTRDGNTHLFEEVGGSPGRVTTLVTKTKELWQTKGIRHTMLLIELREHGQKLPTLSVVADVLHEAAHAILKDYDKNEDEGVAQMEIALAWLISPRVWRSIYRYHLNTYNWNKSYKKIRESSQWEKGKGRALKALDKRLIGHPTLPLTDAFKSPWEKQLRS